MNPIDLASKDYQAAKKYAAKLYSDGIELAYEIAKEMQKRYKLTDREYTIILEKLIDKTLSPLKYIIQEFEYLPEDIKNIFKTEEERKIDKKISELVTERISKMIEEAEKLGRT